VAQVQLLDDGRVRVHGVLPNGHELNYLLAEAVGSPGCAQCDADLIGWEVPCAPSPPSSPTAGVSASSRAGGGRRHNVSADVEEMLAGDAFFVKAFLESEGLFLLQHVNGFVNKYVYLRPRELFRLFEPPPTPTDEQRTPPTRVAAASLPEAASPSGEVGDTGERSRFVRRVDTAIHLLGSDEMGDQGEGHVYALAALKGQMEEGLLSAEAACASSSMSEGAARAVDDAEMALLQKIASVHEGRSVEADNVPKRCPTCGRQMRQKNSNSDRTVYCVGI
jgi:hypothetical protein